MRLFILLLAAGLLPGCGNNHQYPQQVRQNFISGCSAKVKGNTALCECMLGKIEQRYSFTEYVAIEEKMKQGNTPPAFLQYVDSITRDCIKATRK